MSQDRVIHWPASTRGMLPTPMQLGTLCRDYATGIGTVERAGDRWHIRLPGECTAALRHLSARAGRPFEPGEPRTIEVWTGVTGDRVVVYVTTRMQDDITNAIAEGLAAIIARHWRGEREAP